MKVRGIPFDPGRNPQGALVPTAVVLHRTYGAFGKDGYASAYNIGKNGRGGVGIGFHFLVGKRDGQVVQFYDTNVAAAHAKGANGWAVGIEFDGVNEDVLTDWQVNMGALIASAVHDAHNIPLDYYDGPRKRVNAFLNHASVPTSDHTDKVTLADWRRIRAKIARPECACPLDQRPPVDIAAYVQARRNYARSLLENPDGTPALGGLPNVDKNSPRFNVGLVQKAINLVAGRGLPEDGIFSFETGVAIADFQRFMGLPPTQGVVDVRTRDALVIAVFRIAAGVA